MPELPEVETTVRAIRPFENTILKKIIIHNRNLRWQVDENLEDLVANKKILTITRRAKYILIHFSKYSLMLHLGMSGKLRIQNNQDNYFKKHDHVEFIFKDKKIIFNDVRRFGSLHVTKNPNEHILIKNLGVEPLSRKFNKNFLNKLFSSLKNNIDKKNIIDDLNDFININRKFEKWDNILKSLIFAIITELKITDKNKFKIVFNDYLNISKSLVSQKETKLINAIIQKYIDKNEIDKK